ncbi:hypothetical protein BCF74_14710 [Knoellia remsis]|uniref:Probable membrane transporter protein n=1 Tax=Knoellia remsis TaxID=407159 RepID=A0A2T0TT82_9MICO|nr:sulfite exporter TauE/SafE family protein [Knoellia remsis]PRY48916.1 hypothetical protein BCF74_14710 [Knoellia remsis]
MGAAEAALILIAGIAAGTINTIVGSGTLVTFPTLLFLGYPPVTANVSNTVGLVAGGITGSWGYRHELGGARGILLRWAPMSLLGGIVGALLLLVLDPAAFKAIVPVLIGIGVLLVAFGPRITAWTNAHRGDEPAEEGSAGRSPANAEPMEEGSNGRGLADEVTVPGDAGSRGATAAIGQHSRGRALLLLALIFATAVYGGYFGAAQGVILMGVFTTLTSDGLQRLNGLKNVLSTIVNAVAALTFIIVAPDQVDWLVAALIGAGALIGGVVGSRVGRRLPPRVLRAVIITIGIVAIVRMIWFS